ncbi:fungal-specific transcription factor domain-containing protein [Aspergillus floccosus]
MARHQKVVCSSCRRRKTKCDGASPSCSACVASASTCQYEKAPSLAYVRSLQARIRELEAKVRDSDSSPSAVVLSSVFNGHDGDSISFHAEGDLSYHNQTSAIHEGPPDTSRQSSHSASESPVSRATKQSTASIRHSLVANAVAQKNLELLNASAISPQADVPPEVTAILLQLHWCWLHPSFLFVYRPAFTRDMLRSIQHGQKAKYWSATLFKVLCAHSCRFIRAPEAFWCPDNYAETFSQFSNRLMSEAKALLALETLNPPSVPTIQALLQQSARDIACGRSSAAWLYSGMAFRMAIDLGLHVSPDDLQRHSTSLSAEDVEIRKRLFWSLYAWDKHISLYLGRMPNFTMGAENVSLEFLDDFTEEDLWEPFYGPEPASAERASYPPTPGHVVSCFTQLCKLCVLISRVMLDLYSPQPISHPSSSLDARAAAFVTIDRDLHEWYKALPSFLQIPSDKIPEISPPPHITSLNLMYHTTLILLHRPYVVSGQARDSDAARKSWKVCRSATTTIYHLLQMYTKTFGFQHITYMNSYCTYTAATTAVYQLETSEGEPRVSDRVVWTELKFLLDILQRTSTTMPGLNRSIDIIRSRIKKILDRQVSKQLESLFPGNNLPADGQSHASPGPSRKQALGSGKDPTTDDASVSTFPHPSSRFSPGRDLLAEDWRVLDDWLPAFPGQDISFGSEVMLDMPENLSPRTRSALMGSNLYPHMQLNFTMPDDPTFDYTPFSGASSGPQPCDDHSL